MEVNIVESLNLPIQRGPFTSEVPFEERHHVIFPSTTSYSTYSTHKFQRNTSSDITPRLFGYIREVNASYAIIESDSVFYKRHLSVIKHTNHKYHHFPVLKYLQGHDKSKEEPQLPLETTTIPSSSSSSSTQLIQTRSPSTTNSSKSLNTLPSENLLTVREEPRTLTVLRRQFPEVKFYNQPPSPEPKSKPSPKKTFSDEQLYSYILNDSIIITTTQQPHTLTSSTRRIPPSAPILVFFEELPKSRKITHLDNLHQPEILFWTRSPTKQQPQRIKPNSRRRIIKDANISTS